MIVDSGSTNNLVSTEMVEKMELETISHLSPYKVLWLQKGHQVTITKQCLVEFKIGGYNDKILCDVIPMDVFHLLLGRPWQYDKNVIHDGRMNTYTLENNGRTHMLLPIKDKEVKPGVSNTVLFMSGKELLTEVKKKEEPQFIMVKSLDCFDQHKSRLFTIRSSGTTGRIHLHSSGRTTSFIATN